ncbi:MAG: pilus assembly protein TadG-related protein [Candidatus Omnitrophota bacterium]|nr:pilus assembly protein TadG-related protein [Candidatus Omnitrophota bacterium]
MIRLMRKLLSLAHLATTSPRKRGQIATFLLLLVVAVLIFALMTANLGHLSVKATQLDNAADSAALLLGSRLASKSNEMWNHLGQKRSICKKDGLLPVFLKVFVPVVGPIISASITGDDVGTAILEGLKIDIEIAAAFFAGWGMTGSVAGGVVGAVIAAGGNLYSGMHQAGSRMKAFLAPLKRLTGSLPEREQIRESVLLHAFSQAEDDPTTVPDTEDIDDDGDRTEQVSRFLNEWQKRMKNLKDFIDTITPRLRQLIDDFLSGPLTTFTDTITTFKSERLSREEIEGQDGVLVKLLRLLEDPTRRVDTTNTQDYDVPFWIPGLSQTDLETWLGEECGESPCETPPPLDYDSLDGVVMEVDDLLEFDQEITQMDPDERLATRYNWMGLLVNPGWGFDLTTEQWVFDSDPEDTGDFYDSLNVVVEGEPEQEERPFTGLRGWQRDLIDIRDTKLPPCAITSPQFAERTIDNSPCTINQARKDEFNREFANTRAFLAELTNPQSQFYKDLITTRILPNLTEQRLETYTDVRNLTVSLDEPSLAMVGGILTYTFTYTFEYWNDCGVDCPPPTWVQTGNTGTGTVKIVSLRLDGGPTDGVVTYEFTYDLAYDVPRPTPVYDHDGSGGGSACGDGVCTPDEYCGMVNQCEIDCHEDCNPDQGSDL